MARGVGEVLDDVRRHHRVDGRVPHTQRGPVARDEAQRVRARVSARGLLHRRRAVISSYDQTIRRR